MATRTMNRKITRGKGFTLVELIVVMVIIAILAATLVFSLLGYIKRARVASVIVSGRAAYEAAQSLATEEYAGGWTDGPSADEVLELSGAKGEISTMTFSTPGTVDASSAAPFRYKENGITVKYADLVWTEDGSDDPGGSGGSGGSGSTDTYPGTTISLQTSIWPTDADYVEDPDGNVSVSTGGIFKYTDGQYYIVTKAVSLTESQAATGPGGDAYNWYSTQKITGRIISDWTDTSVQKSDLTRGDIVKTDSGYYVFIDGGSWGNYPSDSSKQWYKIP